MKILGYIGTFNESVDEAVAALARQTVPLDEIVVVDNASQYDIGNPFSHSVTVIRNLSNLGPSGAITTGLKYGLDRGYEWMWIFDADSHPRPDALQWLCTLYRSLPAEVKREVGILSCSHVLSPTQRILSGRRFTRGGPRPVYPARHAEFYECDAVIWSGSLYRLEAVRAVGWPRCGRAGFWDDLSHDYGDLEFSNRVRRAGYRILVHTRSLVDQSVGETKELSWLGYSLLSTNHPASRRYLYFRNLAFFWVHLYPRRNWVTLSLWMAFRLWANTAKILTMERDRLRKIRACLRGFWDGLRGRMTDRAFDFRGSASVPRATQVSLGGERSMKILASVAIYNTSAQQAFAALARQTIPIDQIVVVDNASQHGVGGPLPQNVTVIRNSENLGTSGSTAAGLKYGLDQGYEWVWILDGDSRPRPDALQLLCALYRGLSEEEKRDVGILGCSHVLSPTDQILRGRRFTPGGPRPVRVARDAEFYECDAVIWAGSLYSLDAVRAVGFPRCGRAGVWEDLSHDYGDMEYSNRVRSAGYRILVHTRSLVDQPIGQAKALSVFGYSVLTTNHAAWRRYLYFRNLAFFWVYLYPRKNWVTLSLWMAFRLSANTSKILIMERDRLRKIRACFQGFGDGLRKRMTARF